MRIIWWNIFYSAFSSCDTYVGSDRKYAERKECKRNSGVRNISFEAKRVESRKIGKMRVKKARPSYLGCFYKNLFRRSACNLPHAPARTKKTFFLQSLNRSSWASPLSHRLTTVTTGVSQITNLTRMSFKTEF